MAYARANMFYERESWRRPLLISLGFHAFVGLTIFFLGFVMQPTGQSNWGENQGEAVDAKLVSAAPIPIPRNDAQTENIVAHDSKAVTQSPPETKPVETEDGISIPGKVVKPTPQKSVTATNVKPHPMPTPQTAVAYGEGPPVTGPFGTFTAPNMKGGFSFENADFGSKYAWYVDAVKRKVQSNWLTYELDPHINAPHKGGISFDILRDGSVTNIQIAQSSGVPILDQSAYRAVQRVDKFSALPEGSRVTVTFWYDYPPK